MYACVFGWQRVIESTCSASAAHSTVMEKDWLLDFAVILGLARRMVLIVWCLVACIGHVHVPIVGKSSLGDQAGECCVAGW